MDKQHLMFSGSHKQERVAINAIVGMKERLYIKERQKQSQSKVQKSPIDQKKIKQLANKIYRTSNPAISFQRAYDKANDYFINQEAKVLAQNKIKKAKDQLTKEKKKIREQKAQKREKLQHWVTVTKPRIYRIGAFFVMWIVGSLLTAIILMPFSLAAGSNFILLAILGLIEAAASSAFIQEYTISQRYKKLDEHVVTTCQYFHEQIEKGFNDWKGQDK